MPYGLNELAGMSPGYDRLYARNRAVRPYAPYTASPGENPSPAGLYATSGLAGRMTDYGAAQNYAATGYMPSRTVGGGYGLAGYNPNNRLGQQQVLQQASGNQYRPIGNTGMGLAGAWYGGASPGMVGGQQAWVGGPERMAGAGQLPASRYIGGVQGVGGLTAMSPSMPGYDAMQQAGAAFDARGGGLAARQQAYQQRNAPLSPQDQRASVLARVGIRADNARQAQQDQMMAGLMMRNPALAVQMAQMNQNAQLAQQRMGLQREGLQSQERIASGGLASREKIAGMQGTQRMDLAKLQNENSTLQRQHEAALASGKNDLAAKLAQQHDANLLKMQEMQGSTQMGVAGLNTQAQKDIAQSNHGYQNRLVDLQEKQLAQQRSDSLRAQANQAYQSGDIQRGHFLEQQANQSLGAATTPGGLMGAPTAGAAPMAARPAIDAIVASAKSNPEQMVMKLRQIGLSDEQINLELASAFGREGVFNSRYARTAQNPHGGFFTAVDPRTGKPHFTLPLVGGLIPGMAR